MWVCLFRVGTAFVWFEREAKRKKQRFGVPKTPPQFEAWAQ